jgi:SulP family sulfate permease
MGLEEQQRRRHQPNKELFGQGLATIASAGLGGLPATGAIARTSVNVHAGARSRLAAMIHAIFLLFVVLIFAPVISQIPTAVLAGVLIGTSLRIANFRSVKEALQTTRSQRLVYIATALAVLLIDLIWGVVIGLAIDYIIKRTVKQAR